MQTTIRNARNMLIDLLFAAKTNKTIRLYQ
jgi:hypothetical protein